MNCENKEIIKELAQRVVSEYNLEYPIKDFDNFLKQIGIKVVFLKHEDCFLSGHIKKISDSEIIFNIDESFKTNTLRLKKIFAIFLGVLFFETGFRTNSDKWNEFEDIKISLIWNKNFDIYSQFTKEILLPENLMKNKLNDFLDNEGFLKVDEMADYFDVEITLLTNRLKELSLIA